MPKAHKPLRSTLMFFNARKNGYDAGDGPVRYLDGSSLTRPLEA